MPPPRCDRSTPPPPPHPPRGDPEIRWRKARRSRRAGGPRRAAARARASPPPSRSPRGARRSAAGGRSSPPPRPDLAYALEQIRRHQSLLSGPPRGDVSGEPMDVYPGDRRVERSDPLREEPAQDPAQYVARAAGRHPGIAGRIDVDGAIGSGDHRRGAFEDDDRAEGFRRAPHGLDPAFLDV